MNVGVLSDSQQRPPSTSIAEVDDILLKASEPDDEHFATSTSYLQLATTSTRERPKETNEDSLEQQEEPATLDKAEAPTLTKSREKLVSAAEEFKLHVFKGHDSPDPIVEDEFDLVVEAIQQAWCQEMTNAETVEEITAMQNIFIQDTSWSHSKGTIECSNLETQSWVQAQVIKLCSSTELFRAWSTEELKSQKFASCFIDLRAKFIEPRLYIQTALKATGLTGQFTILRSTGHKSPSPTPAGKIVKLFLSSDLAAQIEKYQAAHPKGLKVGASRLLFRFHEDKEDVMSQINWHLW